LAVLSALVVVLAGCVSGAPSLGQSSVSAGALSTAAQWASSLTVLFQQTLDNNGADFYKDGLTDQERTILQRAVQAGSISAADYEAVHATYVACMVQRGINPVPEQKGTDGVYYQALYNWTTASFTDAQYQDGLIACQPLSGIVQFLYSTQQSNPNLYSDQSEAAVDCLRRNGIVDASYTAVQFDQDQASGATAFPFDVYEPVAHTCLISAGYGYFRVDG